MWITLTFCNHEKSSEKFQNFSLIGASKYHGSVLNRRLTTKVTTLAIIYVCATLGTMCLTIYVDQKITYVFNSTKKRPLDLKSKGR